MNTPASQQPAVDTTAARQVRDILLADAQEKFAATRALVAHDQEEFALHATNSPTKHA